MGVGLMSGWVEDTPTNDCVKWSVPFFVSARDGDGWLATEFVGSLVRMGLVQFRLSQGDSEAVRLGPTAACSGRLHSVGPFMVVMARKLVSKEITLGLYRTDLSR